MPSAQDSTKRKDSFVAARKLLAESFFIPIASGTYFDAEDIAEMEVELTKFVTAVKRIATAHDEALKLVSEVPNGVKPFRKPRVDAPKVKAISADIFE